MGKKKAKVEEEFVPNVDYPIDIEINIPTKSIKYSPLAFGTDFCNWKNYVELSDLEKTKKEMQPKIGSTHIDREGNTYKLIDIHTETKEVKGSAVGETVKRTIYIFDLEELNKTENK